MTWFVLICGFWALALALLIIGGILSQKRRWVRCAWCRQWYSDVGEIIPDIDDSVSGIISEDTHGICPECARREFQEFADQLQQANK